MKKIYAYAHTHWDREWYLPFETFRTYLVGVLRQILADMDAGKLSCFYLDGQAIVLEDALEIAPELGPRISALMQDKKLAAGPWYVLPDEMLVCGESLIRNLKMGIDCVRKFGDPALIGYSPDTFGHTQDLPRILCGFGINNAFLWRGVPPLSFGPSFWWQSPDGSQVLAYHLSRGYYQTSLIEKAAAGANGNLDEYANEVCQFAEDRRQWDNSSLYNKTPDALLYPIGGDHTAPPRNLDELLKEVNDKLKERNIQMSTVLLSEFAEHLHRQAQTAHTLVASVAKELRDNCASLQYGNAYLLPGVLSTRLYLKRENREAERRLFRFAEPLFSQLALRGLYTYPTAELAHALQLLLKNHPHDSICGCSIDAVHDEMLIRFARIHQTIDPLLEDAAAKLSGLPENSPKSPDDPAAGLQRLRVLNPTPRNFSGPVKLRWNLSPEKADKNAAGAVQILNSRSDEALFAGWGRVPYYAPVEKLEGYIWVEDVPAFGEVNLSWPLQDAGKPKGFSDAKLRGKTLDNGILKATVDDHGVIQLVWTAEDGSKHSYELNHQFRDCADAGDTYNFDPIPGDKPVDAKLLSICTGQKGPLLASLILKYELKIPDSLIEDKTGGAGVPPASKIPQFKRAPKKTTHTIETEVMLKRGSRILEFETKFENNSSGHRLEVMLSTGFRVHTSFSENHFSLVRRYHQTKNSHKISLPVESGCEAPCDRFPAQRFLISNGQLFLNKGLPEYGAEGESITLTLLRSVSMLSRGRMQTRGGGAGPHIPVPGAECRGVNKVSYAWAPLSVFSKSKILADRLDDEAIVEAHDLADVYEQEMFCAFSNHDDTACGSLLRTSDERVRILNSYVGADVDEVFVRLQNLSHDVFGTRVLLGFDFQSAHLCRLDEEVGEEVFLYRDYVKDSEESSGEKRICALEINFGANEVKTIKFKLKLHAAEHAPAVARSRKKRSSSSNSSKTG